MLKKKGNINLSPFGSFPRRALRPHPSIPVKLRVRRPHGMVRPPVASSRRGLTDGLLLQGRGLPECPRPPGLPPLLDGPQGRGLLLPQLPQPPPPLPLLLAQGGRGAAEGGGQPVHHRLGHHVGGRAINSLLHFCRLN